MSEYINKDETVKILERVRDHCSNDDMAFALNWAAETVKNMSTADVEEVRRGKWEHGREVHREYIGDALIAVSYDKWWCSQCHYTIDDRHYSKITYKRCPECGAHMDKEQEE